MSFPLTRFESVSRRQFLRRSAVLGAVVLVPGVACGNNDKQALSGGDSGGTTTVAGTSGSSGSTPAAGSVAGTTTIAAPSGAAFPTGARLEVNFTYVASDGRARNPYIAVWVETPAGDLVSTVSVWFKSREAKYLQHLTRWYDAETTLIDAGGTNNVDAISEASRPAGTYQVVWNGTDVDGTPVAQGDYVLCIEAAREHGPHGLMTTPITIGTSAFQATLTDDGELTAGSVNFVV